MLATFFVYYLLGLAVMLFVWFLLHYYVTKAAVRDGIREAQSTVRDGVREALAASFVRVVLMQPKAKPGPAQYAPRVEPPKSGSGGA